MSFTAVDDRRGIIFDRVWDCGNIWAGNGNLVPEFAKELVRAAKETNVQCNRFIPHTVDGKPAHRFRIADQGGQIVIFQQTPVGDDEHTVAKYNELGERITDSKELWDRPGIKPDKLY